MWLPGPIYENLPYAYIIGGVLFITGTLYIGLETPLAALYIVCGLISITAGAFVFGWRQAHRKEAPKSGNSSAA